MQHISHRLDAIGVVGTQRRRLLLGLPEQSHQPVGERLCLFDAEGNDEIAGGRCLAPGRLLLYVPLQGPALPRHARRNSGPLSLANMTSV